MFIFTITKPTAANYTPASLVIEWAKQHSIAYHRNKYGELIILLDTPYIYDHWNIADNGDGTESVTIFLIEA